MTTEFHSPTADALPSSFHQRDPSATMSLGNSLQDDNGGVSVDYVGHDIQSTDGDAPSIQPTTTSSAPENVSPEQLKQVGDVLSSEIGIATLLNRLKQSIASAKEFASFLKKRAGLEETHANGVKKFSRATQDSMRHPDHRQGTFGTAYDEMMHTHDRMAENGLQFASSLQQMHDELLELANNAERSRKTWKASGLSAEQKVADMESTMRKSKAKYDAVAEEYERTKMGEGKQTGKVFGRHKSTAQVEEELLKKVQAADQTYLGHVQALQTEKATLLSSTRPETVKVLQDLIKDIDAGVSLQMQKFAAFNEKLLLSNGLSVSPIKGPGGEGSPQQRSLRQAVTSIDNDRDLSTYIAAQHRNVAPNTGEIKYERNPILGGPPKTATPPSAPAHQPTPSSQFNSQPLGPGSRTSTLGLGPLTGGGMSKDPAFPQSPADDTRPLHARSASHGNMPVNAPQQQQPLPDAPGGPGFNGGSSYGAAQGPPQLGALPFQPSSTSSPPPGGPYQPPQGGAGPPGPYGGAGRSPPPYGAYAPAPGPAPSKPVFGLHLNVLYERDGLAVPMVVYQCIQAVDLFGLALEGIYRQSGSLQQVQKLKQMFDSDSSNPALDFRNPENFHHDVNSVTGLLKQFLRDLPDPLLTMEHHDSFIAAAKHDDDIVRRDSLHAIINSLPDPNYATLRALTLHLYRVMDNSHQNRMNSHNLAVIFGPTLMGTDPSTAIADAGWQIKVIDTILQNTYQIFDED